MSGMPAGRKEPGPAPGGLDALATLSEPTRRALYGFVAAQDRPVSRDEAAAATGTKRATATFHLERLVDEALAANPKSVADFRAGKPQAIGFLVGQVMKASRGKANPSIVNALLSERLSTAG